MRFPLHLWPRLSRLITLPAGVGVYCCLCTDADRHALNWDDFGPKGAVMFADFRNYFRIFLWKFMFWTLIFKRSIWLDLIGKMIGMEMFNIFQLSQYCMDFAWIGKDVFICSGFIESAPGGTSSSLTAMRPYYLSPEICQGWCPNRAGRWRWRNHWRIWHRKTVI